MAEEMRQGYCRSCEQYGPVTRRGINHILHLILSIVTLGVWLFVWLALSLLNMGGWRCKRCGSDSVDQVGELFTLKGWMLFAFAVFVVQIVNPEIMGFSMGMILLGSIPAFIVGAHMQTKRREAGVREQFKAENQIQSKAPESVSIAIGGDEEGSASSRNRSTSGNLLASFDPPVAISFDYQGVEEEEPYPREVEVTKLLKRGERLYLYGWCQLREDDRMFRTDRIAGSATVEATGELIGVPILSSPARLQMALMAANVL